MRISPATKIQWFMSPKTVVPRRGGIVLVALESQLISVEYFWASDWIRTSSSQLIYMSLSQDIKNDFVFLNNFSTAHWKNGYISKGLLFQVLYFRELWHVTTSVSRPVEMPRACVYVYALLIHIIYFCSYLTSFFLSVLDMQVLPSTIKEAHPWGR